MSKGISKEEFDRLKPLCSCPEHEEIPWNDNYTKRGYPKYIFGHHPKGKPSLKKGTHPKQESRNKMSVTRLAKRKEPYKTTKEEFDKTAPHICKCGCNEEILWSWRYKYTGIPEYKHGHNKSNLGKKLSEEHCKSISESHKGIQSGKNHPMYGKHHTEESKQKNREKHIGMKHSPETIEKIRLSNTGKPKKPHTEETKKKISCTMKEINPQWTKGIPVPEERKNRISNTLKGKYCGEENPNWQGGTSFYPYCPKFNEPKKEEVRNKYDRKCFLCNLDEKDNITKTGKIWRLSVHHIDGDKQQGCNDKPWFLVPLCLKCHGKMIKNMEFYISYIKDLLLFYNIKEFMINNF